MYDIAHILGGSIVDEPPRQSYLYGPKINPCASHCARTPGGGGGAAFIACSITGDHNIAIAYLVVISTAVEGILLMDGDGASRLKNDSKMFST